MSGPPDKCTIAIVTACMKADGTPTFALIEIEATRDQIENGIHYYFAEAELLQRGYEEPFVHFDANEAPAFLHPAVRQHLQQSPAADEPILYSPSEAS